jgi:hypothetical protein
LGEQEAVERIARRRLGGDMRDHMGGDDRQHGNAEIGNQRRPVIERRGNFRYYVAVTPSEAYRISASCANMSAWLTLKS